MDNQDEKVRKRKKKKNPLDMLELNLNFLIYSQLQEDVNIRLKMATLLRDFLCMAETWRVVETLATMGYLQVSVTFFSNTFTSIESISAPIKRM